MLVVWYEKEECRRIKEIKIIGLVYQKEEKEKKNQKYKNRKWTYAHDAYTVHNWNKQIIWLTHSCILLLYLNYENNCKYIIFVKLKIIIMFM